MNRKSGHGQLCTFLFSLVLIPFVSSGAVAADRQDAWNKLVAAAKKEGRLSLYSGALEKARDIAIPAFKNKYGIDVDVVMGRGVEVMSKIEAERRGGLYIQDVGMLGVSTTINDLKPKGMIVPLDKFLLLPEVTDQMKWKGGKLPYLDKTHMAFGFVAMNSHAIIINSQLVKDGEITSQRDLLNPKWKNKIVMSDPSVSGNANTWFGHVLLDLYGKNEGKKFMQELAKQNPLVGRDERMIVEWVARGKYPIGIGPSPRQVLAFKAAGAPIVWPKLKETPAVTAGTGVVSLFDKVPHPNAATLFINWLLSKEGGEVFSKGIGYPSVRVDVSAEGFDPMLVPGPTAVSEGEDTQLAKGELRKTAVEIFGHLVK